jgi:hypothetical protein
VSPLSTVRALQLNGRATHTWRSLPAGGSCILARMDWTLFDGFRLDQIGGFLLNTEDLNSYWRRNTASRRVTSDSRVSDHLPVVADFLWHR